ncbi:ribokinase [Arenimonas aestuarii]
MPGVVLVVGSYNQDHVWTADQLPAPGATRLGTYASGPGGKGFNQAVAASRAGARTGFLTALGEDAAADSARALADDENIELLAEVHPALPSGTAGIFVDAAGRNVITVAPGANGALSPAYVRAARPAFAGADVVLAQLEVAPEAVLEALALARDSGATTVLNPAPANAPTSPALVALADILTPNETEFAALLSRHADKTVDADTLHALADDTLHALCQSLHPATWVITLGGHGAFVSHPPGKQRGDHDHAYRAPAHPAQPVDTTGAGDAFSGALAAALAAKPDAPFRDSVAFAGRYAARSTERHGAALAMPRRDDLAG